MRLVVATDSFKGSLTASQVASSLAAGWKEADHDMITAVPMADGGEGTCDAILKARPGDCRQALVTNPYGGSVQASFGVLPESGLAVLEMAAASGLHLVPPGKRDPRNASTYGTGELLRAALDTGAHEIIIGVGGSATNDGGAGMSQALGFRLLDAQGKELPSGGAALARLSSIACPDDLDRIRSVKIRVACDVTNPLCGDYGATAVYGPQKGVQPDQVVQLDTALAHFADVLEETFGVSVKGLPRAGAAGGLAAGLHAFLGASLENGAQLVAEAIGLEDAIRHADLIVTGEGRMDGQTLNGKAPFGVLEIARRHGVPVIAIAGSLGPGWEGLLDAGFESVEALVTGRQATPDDYAQTEVRLRAWATEKAHSWHEK